MDKRIVFGIKFIFPILSSDLFPYLWAELAPEQALFIGGMAWKKDGWELLQTMFQKSFHTELRVSVSEMWIF